MKKAKKQVAPNPRMKTIIKAQINEGDVTWITAQRATKLTNWTCQDLQSFREEGYLTIMRKGKKGVRYDLSSVRKLFKELQDFKTLQSA